MVPLRVAKNDHHFGSFLEAEQNMTGNRHIKQLHVTVKICNSHETRLLYLYLGIILKFPEITPVTREHPPLPHKNQASLKTGESK